MKKKLTVFCMTDIHNQQAMLDFPTTLRASAVSAAELAVSEFGKADLTLVGGDNVSDYPNWNKSCALPKKNFLDIKKKLVDCFAAATKDEKVLYVAGNNDMILGDIGTDDNLPYNTTEFYYTGPMNETLGVLSDDDCFTVHSTEKPHENPYLDAFHYVVKGVDFIGINVDPNTAYNSHEGYYTDETLRWVDKKLEEIDPLGTKPVFVVGHLSATYCSGGKWWESMLNGNVQLFYEVLSKHKNLFYLYGHLHGAGFVYKDFSSGAVVHMDDAAKPLDANLSSLDNKACAPYAFTLVHMGGLRPFWHPDVEYFKNDGLTGFGGRYDKERYYPATGTPRLAQYMVFDVYDDRVIFRIRNTGDMDGYSVADKPADYTVFFQK